MAEQTAPAIVYSAVVQAVLLHLLLHWPVRIVPAVARLRGEAVTGASH